MANIRGHKITWDKLDNDIRSFVENKGKKEIIEENINTIMPFKRGGLYFRRCSYIVFRVNILWNPTIRDMPRIIKGKKKSAEFLNRFLEDDGTYVIRFMSGDQR